MESRWSFRSLEIELGGATKYSILDGGVPLRFESFLLLLTTNEAFRSFYNEILVKSHYRAYYWEHPPVYSTNLFEEYEFVLIDSQTLRPFKSDSSDFEEHFKMSEPIVAFPNLGGDAILIAPSPTKPMNAYAHLANFVRYGPKDQIDQLWQSIGQTMLKYLGENKLWLSTCGVGVPWLHIRLDRFPKYYRYRPYKLV